MTLAGLCFWTVLAAAHLVRYAAMRGRVDA